MITEYSCRLEDDEVVAFGVTSGLGDEVLVFDLVLRAVLAGLRSTVCSSSPPEEAKESCGLKYCPADGRSRLLLRVETVISSLAFSTFWCVDSGFTDLLVGTSCD
jgi:hypothetical protein